MEERQILEAVQQGQTDRFAALVLHYEKKAYWTALQWVRDTHEALDLAQEAFLRAFRAIRSFDVSQPFFPWFHRILTNLCLTHLRKRRRVRSLSRVDADGEVRDLAISDEEWEPTRILEADERTAAFRKAFAQIGKRDQQILYLRHFQDLSYAEIAGVLDIPIGTVMSRLFYARQKLKKLLENELS
jgi:RNA polymerase sigma-70 factor, ECF subfamily